jgi:hypothetical protein
MQPSSSVNAGARLVAEYVDEVAPAPASTSSTKERWVGAFRRNAVPANGGALLRIVGPGGDWDGAVTVHLAAATSPEATEDAEGEEVDVSSNEVLTLYRREGPNRAERAVTRIRWQDIRSLSFFDRRCQAASG